ncbi:MAG: lytic transglycosylase domain-containing protein [Bacteroidetes bacterium]|nr:lytic transglycosylase domain-containing protein [Bacteroidota bacterium]
MRKIKHISVLSVVGFLVIQVSKASGIEQQTGPSAAVYNDTTTKKDSIVKAEPLNDNKSDFKNLFQTAMGGDGVTSPRLNPMAISFVENYINRNKKGFESMKKWAKPYFDMMDEVLTQHGVPKEMKYLAVIESGLKYNAISWAGACGPWAFMPAAAKQYGLSIQRGHDERLDYFKSTHAAARLLTDLYAKYGDWLLVLAAYNGGPGNVDRAIRLGGGSKDFWAIQYYLPNESMNHVKKFIGTHYIFEGEGGITTVTRKEMKDLMLNNTAVLQEEEMNNSTSYPITGRFKSAVILKHIEMDAATFNRYNPNFDNQVSLNGKYDLRLPIQKMNTFIAKRYQILDESMALLLNDAGGTK